MRDVARAASVSIQTVSAVVNQKDGITPPTRERVRAAIKQLGYRPYSVARSLRTRQTHTIALVISDIANPLFSTLASAAEDYAHRFGYSLILYNTHNDVMREANYVQIASERWVDGVLFVSARDEMTSLNMLDETGIPTVAIDRIPSGYTGYSVTLDNVKAGRMAAEHLVDLGHTQVAHIAGPLQLRLSRERQQGFVEALASRGLRPSAVIPSQNGWYCEAGFQAMQEILRNPEQPTALFAANDRMAIGALLAAVDAGLRVPEDLSIIGLDDIEVAAYHNPPLTTLRQSFESLATLGIQILIDLLAGKEPEQPNIIIEPELVVRRSTGPGPIRRS
jgi:DNA-binding LacI/PurR family transcriptional regulator